MKQAKMLLAMMFIGVSVLAVGCGNPSAAQDNSTVENPAVSATVETPAVETPAATESTAQ